MFQAKDCQRCQEHLGFYVGNITGGRIGHSLLLMMSVYPNDWRRACELLMSCAKIRFHSCSSGYKIRYGIRCTAYNLTTRKKIKSSSESCLLRERNFPLGSYATNLCEAGA